MRLPKPNDALQSQLDEFDVWITPSLGDITSTDRFLGDLEAISGAIEAIAVVSSSFHDAASCRPEAIAPALVSHLRQFSPSDREEILSGVAAFLFVSTGKSDNNFKCQFPLFLRDAGIVEVPVYKRHGKTSLIVSGPVPRELKSDKLMSTVANLECENSSSRLLELFVSFLIGDARSANQFLALGQSYLSMKDVGRQNDLLAPLVVYKVRGSVMASGGHEPEERLRSLLADWGLEAGVDYNETDAVPDFVPARSGTKSRAFDFILPYRTPGWNTKYSDRLLIQCQFYAGDSGSVSHKNVDQARASRDEVMKWMDHPRYIEFVDGAGYYSSLNGDLRKLLAYEDTAGLIQLRTAPVRLRAYLDDIGFITPLRIEQAIALGSATRARIAARLRRVGFSSAEIQRALQASIERSVVVSSGKALAIRTDRREIVRRHTLLDQAVVLSNTLTGEDTAGKLLVPGYGPLYGVDVRVLARSLEQPATAFQKDYENPAVIRADIDRLCEQGYAILCD